MRRPAARPRPRCRAGAALCAIAALLGVPSGAAAQEWRLDAQGGRLRFDASPAEGASSTALGGLRYLDGATWLGLYAGLPVERDAAAWGMAAGNLRLLAGGGPLRLGMDLAGELFIQGSAEATPDGPLPGLPGGAPATETTSVPSGLGVKAEAMPMVAWQRGQWSAELRAGAARYHSTFGQEATDRDLAQVHAEVGAFPLRALSVSAEARHYTADEGSYPYVGLSAAGVLGRVLGWASAGKWLADGLDEVPWALGARVDVAERAALTGAVRRTVFDPLYLTSGSTSWSMGVSVRLKGPTAPAPPVPASYENGAAVIALPVGQARGAPRVAGDFTDWQPQPMQRTGSQWSFAVHLEPGVYYYAFVTDDGTWYVPESVPGRQEDGFGGHVAVLVVE